MVLDNHGENVGTLVNMIDPLNPAMDIYSLSLAKDIGMRTYLSHSTTKPTK